MAADQFPQYSEGASSGVTDKAPEVAAEAKQQVQQKAEEVKGRASQRAREQLDARSTQLGEQVKTYGRALRNAADQLEIDGHANEAKAVGQAAEQVHRVAGYFTESSSDRFINDLESFGRKRPWFAGGIALTAGFMAARFMKASSESRYMSTYRMPLDANLPLTRDEHATTIRATTPTPPYGRE